MVTIINNVKSKRDDIGLISVRWRDEQGNRKEDIFRHFPYVYINPEEVYQLQSSRDQARGTVERPSHSHRQSTVNNCASGDRTVAVTMHIGRTGCRCTVSCQATTRTNSTTLTVSDCTASTSELLLLATLSVVRTHRSTHPVQSTKNSSAFDQTCLKSVPIHVQFRDANTRCIHRP